MLDDAQLLRLFADEMSEPALGEFVRRHVNFVYATALRCVGGDAHHAADVSQYVFTTVARRAGSLAEHRALKAWLFTVARNASANVVRAERLRQIREMEAHTMQELNRQTSSANADDLRTVLDQALSALSERDQQAVFLRFFEGCGYPEIGARFSVTADAARLRVERALERMKTALSRRGVISTTTALAGALTTQAAVIAPAGLAETIASVAVAGTTGAGAMTVLSLMSKIKLGFVSVIALAGLATAVSEVWANRELRAEIDALQVPSSELSRLQKEDRQSKAELKKFAPMNPTAAELVRLRNRAEELRARPEGVDDALMKPLATVRDAGRATPAAALETWLWAASVGDRQKLTRSYLFSDEMKAPMAAFFARQSEIVRSKYGTPEQLLAELYSPIQRGDSPPVAFQELDGTTSFKGGTSETTLQVWVRLQSGQEMMERINFRADSADWVIPIGVEKANFSDSAQARLASRIDQATGQIRAGKK